MVFRLQGLGLYLFGQGDLVSRFITHITHVVTLIIPIINVLATKSLKPKPRVQGSCTRSFWVWSAWLRVGPKQVSPCGAVHVKNAVQGLGFRVWG